MMISIQENGCRDDEVKLLDTRIPYFFEHMKYLFLQAPQDFEIVLVDSKENFQQFKGENTQESAFIKNNTVYIYEPHLFGVETKTKRKDFYRSLYQEIVYLFYRVNKAQ
jgi:hypothetical protein